MKIGEIEKIFDKKEYIAILDDRYILTKKIGKGATSVIYMGCDSYEEEEKYYAFKISSNIEMIENEAKFLSIIPPNKNTITYYSKHSDAKMVKKSKKTKIVNYIQLQYLQNGSLFDYIYYPKKGFGENFTRLILRGLLNALDHIQRVNIAHLDIKTENIMIDDAFNILIADFGFASKNSNSITTFRGTEGYVPPEVYAKEEFNGIFADIFALGVVLFVVVTGQMPFKTATPNDSYYKMLMGGEYEEFWGKRNIKLSENFKVLFNMMISFIPSTRPSISEIIRSKWMIEGNYSQDNYKVFKEELEKRKRIIRSKKD